MKVAMAQKNAQKSSIRDQVMAEWKAGRLSAEEAQDRLKQAGA